jgi:hypothetical protein
MNPQNKSYEHLKDSEIHSLGFIWIWAYLKYVYVLRILRDLLGFVLHDLIRAPRFNSCSTIQFVLHDSIRAPRFNSNPGFMKRILVFTNPRNFTFFNQYCFFAIKIIKLFKTKK